MILQIFIICNCNRPSCTMSFVSQVVDGHGSLDRPVTPQLSFNRSWSWVKWRLADEGGPGFCLFRKYWDRLSHSRRKSRWCLWPAFSRGRSSGGSDSHCNHLLLVVLFSLLIVFSPLPSSFYDLISPSNYDNRHRANFSNRVFCVVSYRKSLKQSHCFIYTVRNNRDLISLVHIF